MYFYSVNNPFFPQILLLLMFQRKMPALVSKHLKEGIDARGQGRILLDLKE
jgi:hypothetical protein